MDSPPDVVRRSPMKPTLDAPCVLFALRRESRAFLREFSLHQSLPDAPCWMRFSGPAHAPVLVVETGVGPACMETALQWLLRNFSQKQSIYRPKFLLAAGFCGALQEPYQVGDVIFATEVVDATGQCWPATWGRELPIGGRLRLHRQRLLSVSHVVHTPAEKQLLGQQHEAAGVDMESAIVARLCSQHGIPFGCIRAISDDLHTPLSPQWTTILRAGRVSLPRLLAALGTSPRLVIEMERLARQTRHAADQLAKALRAALDL